MIYDSILGTIGRTPVVRIQRLAPAQVTLYAKCEFFNPLSSVKDRLAIALIEDAEGRGALKPGQTVIEATSGNTGIALAMVCAAKGYPFVAVMVESFSVERRRIMRMLGAKVILTPAAERGQGMVKKARELADKHGWYLARQFDSPANPAYHRNTTAPEILSDFAGRRLDYSISSVAGEPAAHRTGVGEVLRVARPETQIIAAEPENAAPCSPANPSPRTRSRVGPRTSRPQCSEPPCGPSHRHGVRHRGHCPGARPGFPRGHLLRHLLRRHGCRRTEGRSGSRARLLMILAMLPDNRRALPLHAPVRRNQ